MTSQLWPISGHTLTEGLLADPVVVGIAAYVVPLLLDMNTVFIPPVTVPVVWLVL